MALAGSEIKNFQKKLKTRLNNFSQPLEVIWQFLFVTWPLFGIVLFILAVLGGIAPLLQIYATSTLFDQLVSNVSSTTGSTRDISLQLLLPYLPAIGLLIGSLVLTHLLTMETFQPILAAHMTERVRDRFDQLIYQKVLALQLEMFENKTYYDKLELARLAMDEKRLITQLGQLQRTTSALFSCVGYLIAFLALGWGVVLLLLIISIVLSIGGTSRSKAFLKLDLQHSSLRRRANYWRTLLTTRETAAEVRLFGLATYIINGWKELATLMMREMVQARNKTDRRALLISAIWIVLQGVLLASLVFNAFNHSLSPGQFVALAYASQQFIYRVGDLGWTLDELIRFFAQHLFIPQFLALPGEEKKDGLDAPFVIETISFENVSFTYPGSTKPSLSNLTFQINLGDRIALVGENGAGKSTLVKLLLGLYQPTEGCIKINGINLKEIAPSKWRTKLGAVFQEYIRFSLTASENIGLGNLDKLYNFESIERAAKLSDVATTLEELPKGYETLLGKEFEGGHDLSKGQWQKLALARAYLRNPQVLVLDEPTSALDALAELEIYRHFVEISKDKTVLLISHRLGSARLAKHILFLEKGEILEQGSHDELILKDGFYAKLYAMQAAWYSADETGISKEVYFD